MDMSLFKNHLGGTSRRLEVRIESVNIFNHVNLGNPDSTIGVPGNAESERRPHHGRPSGAYTARNFQFGLRFVF